MAKNLPSKKTIYDELSESDIDPEERQQMIAEAAYYRAKQRGFIPGYEQDDWYAAENYVDSHLLNDIKEEVEA